MDRCMDSMPKQPLELIIAVNYKALYIGLLLIDVCRVPKCGVLLYPQNSIVTAFLKEDIPKIREISMF
jgi:hypothetical protein